MGNIAAAPDALGADPAGTPAQPEPAQPDPAPEPAPDQPGEPTTLTSSQAEYTRAQQAFAALRSELGLPRTATRDEVLATIRSLKQPTQAASEPDDEALEDPRVAEALQRAADREQRAFDALLAVQTGIYGEDFTSQAIEAINLVRTSNDPTELFPALHALVQQFGGGGAPAPAPSPAVPAQPDPLARPDIDLADGGGGGPAPTNDAPRRGREPGVVGAVRGIFAEAAQRAARPS